MMKTGKTDYLFLVPALAAILLASCASGSGMSPTEAAHEVAARLVSGDVAGAGTLFDDALSGDDEREIAYSILFEQGESMCSQRDYDACTRINRFLTEHYPKDVAAKEALLYALMLKRAREGKALDQGTRKEMLALGKDLREGGSEAVWADLALAQVAVDDGNLQVARASMARFKSRWNGQPATLTHYATELERYLASH